MTKLDSHLDGYPYWDKDKSALVLALLLRAIKVAKGMGSSKQAYKKLSASVVEGFWEDDRRP